MAIQHDTAAQRLARNKNRVIEMWEKRVRHELSSAAFESRLVLLDSLPLFLDEIIKALEVEATNGAGAASVEVLREHGRQRAALGSYSLDQLLMEYNILQEILLKVLEEDEPLQPVARNVILNTLFRGLKESGIEFVNMQLQHERESRDRMLQFAEKLKHEQEMRERFVYALTHDMRTPLTVARASAELLLRTGDKVENRSRLANKVIEFIDRANHLIQDLLDASALRAGDALRLEILECDLQQIIIELSETLAMTYGARFTVESSRPEIGYWDPRKLRQAIDNLVSNAAKYGWEDTPITIRVQAATHEVRLEVHNIGNPLSKGETEKIFDSFYRKESAFKSGKKGWGLGLAVVRGVTEAHGGRVEVRSNATDGTCFTLILPRDSRPFQRPAEPPA